MVTATLRLRRAGDGGGAFAGGHQSLPHEGLRFALDARHVLPVILPVPSNAARASARAKPGDAAAVSVHRVRRPSAWALILRVWHAVAICVEIFSGSVAGVADAVGVAVGLRAVRLR